MQDRCHKNLMCWSKDLSWYQIFLDVDVLHWGSFVYPSYFLQTTVTGGKKKTFTIVYWIFNYYSNTLLLLLLMLRVIFKLETAGISQPIFSVLLCWFIWRSSVFQCLLRKLQIIWAHDENTLTIKGHGWLLAMNKRQIIKKCKCKMMNNCW